MSDQKEWHRTLETAGGYVYFAFDDSIAFERKLAKIAGQAFKEPNSTIIKVGCCIVEPARREKTLNTGGGHGSVLIWRISAAWRLTNNIGKIERIAREYIHGTPYRGPEGRHREMLTVDDVAKARAAFNYVLRTYRAQGHGAEPVRLKHHR